MDKCIDCGKLKDWGVKLIKTDNGIVCVKCQNRRMDEIFKKYKRKK